MYVNVEDAIFWLSPTIESCNLIDFISVAYAQLIPLKLWPNAAQGCNHQSTCMIHDPYQLQPLCSAALVPNVLPRRDEGSGKPRAVIEAL